MQKKSSLSRGAFRVDQIIRMELAIIRGLRWHLNPPTPLMYLDVASPIIGVAAMSPQASFDISELTRYLIELSVCDSFFIDKKPSSVAYAAILVAMDVLATPIKIRTNFALYRLDTSPHATQLCCQRLKHVHSLATACQAEEDARTGSSPTSIFQELS